MKRTETDWNAYYSSPYPTAMFSRRITGHILVRYIQKYRRLLEDTVIAELGGADSCFYPEIRRKIAPRVYHILDKNQLGLDRFSQQNHDSTVILHQVDLLDFSLNLQVDLVFSVGLIEHFGVVDTRSAIKAHFDILKPGGICILSFPTPTLLYRIARRASEISGMWIFHDERPLEHREVFPTVCQFGAVLDKTIIWPIILTQEMLVIQKAI